MTITRTLLVAALCSAPVLSMSAQGYAVASSAAKTPAKIPATSSAKADLLDRAVTTWAKVKTIRATFEQTIVNPLTGTSQHSTGSYLQRRPGKLAVQFDAPYEDRIVADGTHLWLYLPSSAPGQVIRTRQDANGAGAMDISAQFMSAPRKRYDVTALGAHEGGTTGYRLVPKAGSVVPFKSATLWIGANAVVKRFEVTELNGVERTVVLTSYAANAPIAASAFSYVPPTGVRVVER